MMLHVNAASLRGLTYFIFGKYNVVSRNYRVEKFPLGEGSIASARPGEFQSTFLCDMGLPCSSSNNSKSI